MYQRILNKLDVNMLKEEADKNNVPRSVLERVEELVAILDSEYGTQRTYKDMGGYILFMSDIETYQKAYSQIITHYQISEETFEYSEIIKDSYNQHTNEEWVEKLYMLSSDDALVFIYPRKAQGVA